MAADVALSHRMKLLATCDLNNKPDPLQRWTYFGRDVYAVGDERAWSSVDLSAAERTALENVDIAWLYAHGANDFLLHNLFRFGVGGVTIEHYVRGIKAHLTSPGAGG